MAGVVIITSRNGGQIVAHRYGLPLISRAMMSFFARQLAEISERLSNI
jgi:hypothetical protein